MGKVSIPNSQSIENRYESIYKNKEDKEHKDHVNMELFNKYNMNFFKDSFEDAYMKFKEKNPRDALLKIFPYYTRSKTVELMLSKNISFSK